MCSLCKLVIYGPSMNQLLQSAIQHGAMFHRNVNFALPEKGPVK